MKDKIFMEEVGVKGTSNFDATPAGITPGAACGVGCAGAGCGGGSIGAACGGACAGGACGALC